MSKIEKRQSSCSCPDSPSKCNRKRSIYSKNATTNSCKYLGRDTCDDFPTAVDDPYPQGHAINKGKKSSDVEVNSVGSAIGLTCKCLEEDLRDQTFAQDFATYLKAFALIYVLPEDEWTAENIDKLLMDSEELFEASSAEDQGDGPLHQSSIYNSIEQLVKRNFKLKDHSFTLELKPPYLGQEDGPMNKPLPHIIKNLKPVLKGFFHKSHYCLLLYKTSYLLIWRRHKVYFVMDIKSDRRANNFVSYSKGVTLLVCLKTIDNVVHLISNLSGVSLKDKFFLRELAVVRLITPDGRIFRQDDNQPSVEYKVISKNYAYLKSSLHLSLNPKETLRNSSSIIVGVAAILASKIDHPASWSTKMFDRLMCFGVELCRNCWSANLQNNLPIDLDKFPTQLRLGQFVVELKLSPEVCNGVWRSGSYFKDTDFEHKIGQSLKFYGNALFQINNQMYALWYKDNFYYLLDPYRHTVVCSKKKEDGTSGAKCATVRMFRDSLTMLSVFHQLLKESNRNASFFIHVVRIKKILECPQGYALKPTPDGDIDCDVKSLNETITFPESLKDCEKFLGNISDYETNLNSDMDGKLNLEYFKRLDNKYTNLYKDLDGEETITPTSESTDSKPEMLEKNTQTPNRTVQLTTNARIMKPKAENNPVMNRGKSSNTKCTANTTKKLMFTKRVVAGATDPRTIMQAKEKDQARTIKPIFKAPMKRRDENVCDASKKTIIQEKERERDQNKSTRPTGAISLATTKKREGLCAPAPKGAMLEKEKAQAGTIKPIVPTAKVPIKRRDGVWPVRGTGNLCALRKDARIPAGRDVSKRAISNRCNHRQTNGQTADAHNTNCQTVDISPYKTDSCTDQVAASTCKPIKYPVYTKYPHNLAVIGSESGTVESLQRLLDTAFEATNRVVTITPWGNYVVFRQSGNEDRNSYMFYVFDGCTCNIDRFRHLDLTQGTAGLLAFSTQQDVISYLIDSRESRALKMIHTRLDQPCICFEEFLGRGA